MEKQTTFSSRLSRVATIAAGSPLVAGSVAVLICMALSAICAPWLAPYDPVRLDPVHRLLSPTLEHLFGTDRFGRDVFSRVIYGARVSLVVAALASIIAVVFGATIGLLAGYFRMLDAVVMRVMDGLMAIPGILLAIALVAVMGSSLMTIVLAIALPEVPRMVRVVRGVVLTVRDEAYVEAAITLGTPSLRILWTHILPNAVAPMIVLGSYIASSAILVEAILGFLGVGISPDIPSWGNIIAEGRIFFQVAPWLVLLPGIVITLTILAVNVAGDAMRDGLDPRLQKVV